ncbi:MAG TPA: hypothetical protein VNA25_08160, partial [Phycisphaerae bacterium]|nr:hypothetical protein [Phycisphaerae bacterium]
MNKSDVRRLVRRLLATTLKRLSDGSGSPLDSALRREADCLMAPAECFAAALHCGPLVVEEPLRNGDRVVVVDAPSGLHVPCSFDIPHAGKHGTVAELCAPSAMVRFDSGGTVNIWLHNLRRERPDEMPA